ncbi:hypothetical protein SAMN05518800_6083 [Variovorax sp. YR752]|uniref:hypothetical protein n=1 Tax=Variovorax sp. YR752 TaxID=1884383 RepID=UPI000BD30C06|nr:hypothetical protein [Variovorax sp. YR752]SOD30475.1 hypothetical protein SAMN05518800_6083 [Variovorax sp. YR752]
MKYLRETRIPIWLVLGLGTLVYCYFYLNHPALPGNNLEYPRGWWGWFDQGEYIKAAAAIRIGDFSHAKHAYPPLYPAIGSIFMPVLPVHPFFFFNLLSLLAFAYVFVAFATRYMSQLEAFALLAISLYFNEIIILNFAIPWTTTGTTLIYAVTIYQLLQKSKQEKPSDGMALQSAKAFLFSSAFSLLAILRPVDAGAAAVFYPAYLYFSFKSLSGTAAPRRTALLLAQAVSLGAGLLVGMGLFFLFNLKVHGHVLGGYFQSTATASGYFPLELPRKIFSLVFDSNTVFLDPNGALITHFPWLVLSIIGVTAALVRGSAMLRVMAAALCLQFCLYAPYGDLLPNGVYRYYNIHYFKWMFPYLAFFGWLVVRWIFQSPASSRPKGLTVRTLVVLIAVAALLSPQYKVKPASPIALEKIGPDNRVAFSTNGDGIDFIDFYGMAGGFNEIYLGDHHMLADGKPLNRVKEFRLLPAPWGVRVFFNKRVRAKEFVLTPDKGVNLPAGELTMKASTYRFRLGMPKLIHDAPPKIH